MINVQQLDDSPDVANANLFAQLDRLLLSSQRISGLPVPMFYIDDPAINSALSSYATTRAVEWGAHSIKYLSMPEQFDREWPEKDVFQLLLDSYQDPAARQLKTRPKLLQAIRQHTRQHPLRLLIITNLQNLLACREYKTINPYFFKRLVNHVEEDLMPESALFTMTPSTVNLYFKGALTHRVLPLKPFARNLTEIKTFLFPPDPFSKRLPPYSPERESILFEQAARYIPSCLRQGGFGQIRLKEARRAIAAFEKYARRPQLVIDLILHTVEEATAHLAATGGQVTAEYIYISLEEMFEKALKLIVQHEMEDGYTERCRKIVHLAEDLGYSYPDSLAALSHDYLQTPALSSISGADYLARQE